jgi:hypothetical protein
MLNPRTGNGLCNPGWDSECDSRRTDSADTGSDLVDLSVALPF